MKMFGWFRRNYFAFHLRVGSAGALEAGGGANAIEAERNCLANAMSAQTEGSTFFRLADYKRSE
jgi:hypothetical protein